MNPVVPSPQSQCDAEIPSVFAFQAAVHKQTNAIQHFLASIRTAPNFLASESFPWHGSKVVHLILMRIRGTAESFTFRHRILETCCHRNKFQVFSFIDISSITKLQKIGFFDFCTLHFTASNASFVKPDYPSKVAYHFLIVHRSDKKL